MKNLVLFIFLAIATSVNAQDSHYEFSIKNVTNLVEAKYITDPLRFLFNSYPTFIDSTNKFSFNCVTNVSKQDLKTVLNSYDYELEYFSKAIRTKNLNEETKEE